MIIFMNKEKVWTRGFTILTLSNGLINVGVHMLTPAIPLYLVSLGALESQVGIVATSFLVASIVMRMAVNFLLAKTGKKLLLIMGVLINTVVMFFFGMVDSLGATAVLRAIQGMGFGITTTLTATMAADFLPDSRRGEGIGYFSMAIVLAITIGPALSLFILENLGFQLMFFTASGFSVIATIVLLFSEEPVIKGLSAPEEKEKPVFRWKNLYDSRLILPTFLIVLFGVSRSADQNFISIFAQEKGFANLAWYYPICTITMFCIRFIVGRFTDRKGRNWILIPGGFAMLALLITLSLAKSSGIMLLGAFFSGLGVGVLAPGMQLWMFSCVEPERRNIASTTYFNFMDVGIGIGAFSLGFITESAGYSVMFQTAAFAALLFIVLYVTIGREKTRI